VTNPLPPVTHIYQNHHLDSTRWNQFQPRNNDIVISTSYKSGTTWTQGIVKNLIFIRQEIPPLGDLSPWLDRRGRPLEEVLALLEAQTHRRFIKSHLALDGVPFYPQIKYIVVGRDARDVFMSLWNHYSHYTPEQYANLNDTPGRVGAPLPHCPTDIHEFYQNWMTRGWFAWESEGYPFWGNLHHTAAWWAFRHLENVLFVHYNDLLRDLYGEICRIANFLEIPLTEQESERVANAVSLDSMREEAIHSDAGLVKSFVGGADTFFFKGVNGRWKEVLSDAELDLYERKVNELLSADARHWIENGRLD
jgi:aryl sulfotransferase